MKGRFRFGVAQFEIESAAGFNFESHLMDGRLSDQRHQMQRSFETEPMPQLRIPGVDQEIKFPVDHQIQIECFVPIEIDVARSDDRSGFVCSVAFQDAVQIANRFQSGRCRTEPSSGQQMYLKSNQTNYQYHHRIFSLRTKNLHYP